MVYRRSKAVHEESTADVRVTSAQCARWRASQHRRQHLGRLLSRLRAPDADAPPLPDADAPTTRRRLHTKQAAPPALLANMQLHARLADDARRRTAWVPAARRRRDDPPHDDAADEDARLATRREVFDLYLHHGGSETLVTSMLDKPAGPSTYPPGGWGTTYGRLVMRDLIDRHDLVEGRRARKCHGPCKARCRIYGSYCGGQFVALGCPKCYACTRCRTSWSDVDALAHADGLRKPRRLILDNLPPPSAPTT